MQGGLPGCEPELVFVQVSELVVGSWEVIDYRAWLLQVEEILKVGRIRSLYSATFKHPTTLPLHAGAVFFCSVR